jgi:hypothetical protein
LARMVAVLVIDENIVHRVATELSERGRPATSVQSQRWKGRQDGPLIDKIIEKYGNEAILVTADNQMSADHPGDVAKLRVAIVDPLRPNGYSLVQWRRDVVHRWAHFMQEQPLGTVRRYGLTNRAWTLRTRRSARRLRSGP